MLPLLTGIGKFAKGALGKPKTPPKVNAKKFAGQVDRAKASSGAVPKGALVPSPGGAITKIVDVKVDKPEKTKVATKDPLIREVQSIYIRTIEIQKALRANSKAKKERLKLGNRLAQLRQRKARENLLEGMAGKLGAFTGGLASKMGLTSLWDNILKTLGILFAGWLAEFLPQIIGFVQNFIKVVGKIVAFLKPIVTPIFNAIKGFVVGGVKFLAQFAGYDKEESEKASFLKNLTELVKRTNVIEMLFAAIVVGQFRNLGGDINKKFKGKKDSKNIKGKDKVKGSKIRSFKNQKIPTKAASTVQKRHGHAARKIYENAIKNGKSPRAANAAVERALKSGKITSKPQLGNLKGGIKGSRVLKGGVGRSLNRIGTKFLGKAALKGIKGVFGRTPIVGPLIVGIGSLLAGEPLGRALFKAVGAGLGGALGTFIPIPVVGTLLGEAIGLFIGDVLYEGLQGKGWGAAGQKLKDAWNAILTGAGKIGKAFIDFLFGGGLVTMLKNAGERAFNAVKNFFQTGTQKFISNFPMIDISKVWMLPRALGGAAGLLGLDKYRDEDGKVNKIPNIGLLAFPPLLIPHLMKSFFGIGEKKDPGSIENATPAIKRNILGIPLADQGEEESLKPSSTEDNSVMPDASEEGADIGGGGWKIGDTVGEDDASIRGSSGGGQSSAASISSSASYDQHGRGGVMPIPIGNVGDYQPGFGGATVTAPTARAPVPYVNRYEIVNDYKKSIILAKLYRG